jgi:hypothetical protein
MEKDENLHSPVTPKGLDLTVWNQNSTKRNQCTDDERVDERSEHSIRCVCSHELTNSGVDELVDQHDEEYRAGRGWLGREADSEVETDKVEDCADNEVGDFRDDQTSDESLPVVHLALLLSGLVNVTTFDEEWLKLGND